MQHIILKLIVVIYLIYSFIGATHIHSDSKEKFGDCQICTIIKAFSDVDLPDSNIIIDFTLPNYFITPLHYISVEIVNLKGFFSHAPPL